MNQNNINHAKTTVQFNKDVLLRLKKYGKFGDTWEMIVIRLMDNHDNKYHPRDIKGHFIKQE